MIDFPLFQLDNNDLKVISGGRGLGIFIIQEVETPNGILHTAANKALSNEEAILLRDYLNKTYPTTKV